MIQSKSKIISNEQLVENCWRITLEAPQIASEIKPGQFINVKIGKTYDPLFRRPFSVFRRVKQGNSYSSIEIVYKVVGKGTRLMTDLEGGDELDVIGPLGHGFEWDRNKKVHVLLGGGVGLPVLFMLGEEISQAASEYGLKLFSLLGVETKKAVVLEKEFGTLNSEVMVSTDDGTYGYHGFVPDMLKDAIDRGKIPADCAVYACGPEPCLKALVPIHQQYNIPIQVSMERHMACGIGTCLSCVCKVGRDGVAKYRDLASSHIQFGTDVDFGYALVCTDGPVFNIEEVIFDD